MDGIQPEEKLLKALQLEINKNKAVKSVWLSKMQVQYDLSFTIRSSIRSGVLQ